MPASSDAGNTVFYMKTELTGSVYPVMLTPYTQDLQVDYPALNELVDWYINNGCDGLFAVCQSSEMFFLTEAERVKIAETVVKRAAGRVQVVTSGHISETLPDQLRELGKLSSTGAHSVVLVTNRLAAAEEGEEKVRESIERILTALPDTDFGLYECPYPYKRLFSPEMLAWCAKTGRFTFFKDTSCNMEAIGAKINAVRGSRLRFYNANTATILDSLRAGGDGFSGVMANVHPQLYAWLTLNAAKQPKKAEELQAYLNRACKQVETVHYSLNAKYLLGQQGLAIQANTRNPKIAPLNDEVKAVMRAVAEDDRNMLEFLKRG